MEVKATDNETLEITPEDALEEVLLARLANAQAEVVMPEPFEANVRKLRIKLKTKN